MKTPWSDLLKHGVVITMIVVGCLSVVIVITLTGVVVLVTKFLVFIK